MQELEIPSRWVLFTYLALEVMKFLYDRFINQTEYIRILRDIAASQHATAVILKEIAGQFRVETKQIQIQKDLKAAKVKK